VKRSPTVSAPLADGGRIYVVSSEEIRAIDRETIAGGVPGGELMERAGEGAVELIREHYKSRLRRGVVIVAGKGNNGGDAFVMARLLHKRRVWVEMFLAARESDLAGDAKKNWQRWKRAGGRVRPLDGVEGLTALAEATSRAGLVVDGLFGTGLRGELDERAQAIVSVMNAAAVPIVAIDVPSGLDADRGVPLGAAVQATMTATFAYPKTGLLLQPGATYAGEVVVVDIAVSPLALEKVAPRQRLLTAEVVASALPPRAEDTHKGTYGHVVALAGAAGKSGAALLCGRAALRAGAGLVTIAAPGPALGAMLSHTPELMTEALPDTDGAWKFSRDESTRIAALLQGKDAVILGPGIGTGADAKALTEWLIEASPRPVVIDADGLNCLATNVSWLAKKRSSIVLTPHPGEMGRLVDRPTSAVQADRVGVARRFATEHGVTVVLKGSRTVIASPGGIVSINPTGNPGMASGGMGDALAGIIGSLLAQGLAADEAAEAGVYWHGAAGDRVAKRQGEAGLLASDLIGELPATLRELQTGFYGDAADI